MNIHRIDKLWNVKFSFIIIFIVNTFQLSAQIPSYNWEALKIGGGGYVTGVVIHPLNKDIMYARTDVGGAYRWDVKAEQWEQMLNWVGPDNANLIGVDGMAVDPNLPNRIYLALGRRIDGEGGVYRSDDRGETWKKLMSASFEGNGRAARWFGECIAVDPNSSSVIYAGTRKNGLWQSSDEGKTWSKVTDIPDGYTGINPTGVRTILFNPAKKLNGRSSILYVGIPGSGIFFSNDCGVSFAPMNGSPKNPARMQVVKQELFVSHDTGVALWSDGKWQDISPMAGKNYVGLAIDVNNNRKIIAAQRYGAFSNPIYRSENKGQTWEQINTDIVPAKLNVSIPWWPKTWFSSATAGMALVPDGSGGLYFTDWFGVWYTPNVWAKSTDWFTVEEGHEETVVLTLVSPPSGALVYSGMADVFGFRHDKIDAYPEKRLYPLNECFSIAVCEKQPSNVVILGAKSWGGDQTRLATSSDLGATWTDRTLPEGAVLGIIAISALNPNRMVYLSGMGKVYHSQNGGDSWEVSQNAPENVAIMKDVWFRDHVLASDMVDGSFYIFKEGILYRSIDGVYWTAKQTIPEPSVTGVFKSVVPVPGSPGEIWISLDKDGLWKTTDAGNTYSRVSAFKDARLITWGAPAPDSAYPTAYCYGTVESKWGLYRSIDKGENWVRINDDKHQFPAGVKAIAGDRNVFGRIYVGSGGSGIIYGEPGKSK
jgi:photosystem II stability/assembly factor-like uncharacterized protein